jgi:hypothetical protein
MYVCMRLLLSRDVNIIQLVKRYLLMQNPLWQAFVCPSPDHNIVICNSMLSSHSSTTS